MKKTLCLCLLLIINHSAYANDMTSEFKKGLYTALKTKTLKDYNARCEQVLISKGYKQLEVSKKCDCEIKILDNNIKDEQYLKIVQRAVLKQPIFTKEEIEKLKIEIKQCK